MTTGIDLAGSEFGFLKVLRQGDGRFHDELIWVCLCVCGREVTAPGRALRHGLKKSCGCKKSDMIRVAHTTHGGCSDPEYRVWAEMIRRCENPNCNRYYTHGARGIKVCDRWRQSYAAFIEDMGRRPEKRLTLERQNNDGNYEPSNCRWATKTEQARNRRNTVFITANGQTKPLMQWSEERGIKSHTIHYRIKAGWTPEEAVGLA